MRNVSLEVSSSLEIKVAEIFYFECHAKFHTVVANAVGLFLVSVSMYQCQCVQRWLSLSSNLRLMRLMRRYLADRNAFVTGAWKRECLNCQQTKDIWK